MSESVRTINDALADLADTLAELAPVEQVTRCMDCPCCIWRPADSGMLVDCANDTSLILTDLSIRHPKCPRVGKITEWPA